MSKKIIELKKERNEAIKTAIELFYPQKYINQLKQAKTVAEINRILKTARLTMWGILYDKYEVAFVNGNDIDSRDEK